MTAHPHSKFDPTCYRCDLGRDEEISSIAEDYFEEHQEPDLAASGMSQDAIDAMKLRYISDVRKNQSAIDTLYDWALARTD